MSVGVNVNFGAFKNQSEFWKSPGNLFPKMGTNPEDVSAVRRMCVRCSAHHPTNAQVKSIMTRNFHLLTLPSYKLSKSMCASNI